MSQGLGLKRLGKLRSRSPPYLRPREAGMSCFPLEALEGKAGRCGTSLLYLSNPHTLPAQATSMEDAEALRRAGRGLRAPGPFLRLNLLEVP